MVTVRFFGMTRLMLKADRIEIDAGTIDELIEKVCTLYSSLKTNDLRNCIFFVNGTNMLKLKMYKTQLKDGDEVQVFSPAVGG